MISRIDMAMAVGHDSMWCADHNKRLCCTAVDIPPLIVKMDRITLDELGFTLVCILVSIIILLDIVILVMVITQ